MASANIKWPNTFEVPNSARNDPIGGLLHQMTQQQMNVLKAYKGILEGMHVENGLKDAKERLTTLKTAGSKLIDIQREQLIKMLLTLYPMFAAMKSVIPNCEDPSIELICDRSRLHEYNVIELSYLLKCYVAKLGIYIYNIVSKIKVENSVCDDSAESNESQRDHKPYIPSQKSQDLPHMVPQYDRAYEPGTVLPTNQNKRGIFLQENKITSKAARDGINVPYAGTPAVKNANIHSFSGTSIKGALSSFGGRKGLTCCGISKRRYTKEELQSPKYYKFVPQTVQTTGVKTCVPMQRMNGRAPCDTHPSYNIRYVQRTPRCNLNHTDIGATNQGPKVSQHHLNVNPDYPTLDFANTVPGNGMFFNSVYKSAKTPKIGRHLRSPNSTERGRYNPFSPISPRQKIWSDLYFGEGSNYLPTDRQTVEGHRAKSVFEENLTDYDSFRGIPIDKGMLLEESMQESIHDHLGEESIRDHFRGNSTYDILGEESARDHFRGNSTYGTLGEESARDHFRGNSIRNNPREDSIYGIFGGESNYKNDEYDRDDGDKEEFVVPPIDLSRIKKSM